MRAKAKSSSTPYPIWVEGEYITEPPIRPSDGAIRPAGHYIDKGGYPGANVYEVDINTMCRQIEVGDLDAENIKNIGSMVDYSDFVEGIRYHADNGLEIPYIPCLDVQVTALPYFKLKCLKCGQISLSCAYMAKHKGCGGYYTVDFATKIYRERAKEKELA